MNLIILLMNKNQYIINYKLIRVRETTKYIIKINNYLTRIFPIKIQTSHCLSELQTTLKSPPG